MNIFEPIGTLPQTLNECRRGSPEEPLPHSKGGPDANPTKNRISVRFATHLPENVEIKPRRPTLPKTWAKLFVPRMTAWAEEPCDSII
jgi:hypothetical protein